MASDVERAINNAVVSLMEKDDDLAQQVIAGDQLINQLDVKIDEECIRILALTQPVAKDLRFITTAMKITTDLERIADNAVNISERVLELNREQVVKSYVKINRIEEIASGMVKDAIKSFVKEDKKLAKDILTRDDEVDELNEQAHNDILLTVSHNPQVAASAVTMTYISKYLERIADHATNIAETVIYMIEGKMIRHAAPGLKEI
jgi:phosphate transport system protein